MSVAGLRTAFLRAAVAVALLATPAQAQTRDKVHGVYPGQKITNVATWRDDAGKSGRAEATFTVAPLPSHPILRVYTPARGRPSSKSVVFHDTDHLAGGEFRSSDPPFDRSGVADNQGSIDLANALPIIGIDRISYGAPLFYLLTNASLNLRADRIDTAILTLRDALTGDEETLRLYETGPDTGDFGGWIDTRRDKAQPNNGVLSTRGYSRIDAIWSDAFDQDVVLTQRVLVGPVDPLGVVYDSTTGAPVNGAAVTLIDIKTNKPARVLGDDLLSAYPARIKSGGVVTDASGQTYDLGDGQYRFPYVAPGTYRIEVEPPEGYLAPSTRTEADINTVAPKNMKLRIGALGEKFTVASGPPVVLGIPVDRLATGAIERDGSLSLAQGGDFIAYTVTIEPPPASAIDIVDTLLPEIRFVPGTLRIDGQSVTPRLTTNGFVIEGFAVTGRDLVMTYIGQVTVGAEEGESLPTTTTVTEARTGRMAMSDDHVLEIEAPFGTDETVILGQVIAGPCGAPEENRDLSGIRILLETGDVSVTDGQGRFHFLGIASRPHVVQLDRTSLPRHAEPILCRRDTRNAGSAISTFVDVGPGMMARAEFHVVFDAAAETVEAKAEADFEVAPERADPTAAFDATWLARQGGEPNPAILAPAKGWVPDSDAFDVVVLKPAGAVADLRLNGKPVLALRLDQPVVDPVSGASLERWHALRLRDSRNQLTLVVRGADGAILLNDKRVIYNETTPFRADLVTAGSVLESDGRTTPIVQLRVLGRSGGPVRPGTRVQVQIDAPYGFEAPVVRDSQPTSSRGPSASASAVVTEGGLVRLRMAAVRETGTARVTVVAPDRRPGQEIVVDVPISAAERPWVLVGLAEGTLAEGTIRDHMRRSGDIGNDLAGRVSFFAEGVIAGEWLLTLRVDTARDGEGAFSAIDPERDYVVYGDASYQEDGSPSRFPLYLRLKSEEAEYLVGDFTAVVDTRLVNLNREVTGLRVVRETAQFRVMAFAARSTQRYVEDRIAIDGTSGPYQLTRTDIVPRSETVTLIEVDGDDISREVAEEVLQSGADYTLSPTTGRLYLRRPIPAFTPDLNRFVLKVGYETDEEIKAGVLAAIRAEQQITERVRVGVTVVRADNANGGSVGVTLFGADIVVKLNEDFSIGAEVLQALRDGSGGSEPARAAEIFADYDDGTNKGRFFLRRENGDTSIDSALNDRAVDSLGAEGEMLLLDDGSEDHPEDGLWLAGEANGERDRRDDRSIVKGGIELVRRAEGVETATGLRFFDEKDTRREGRTIQATSRLAWQPDDGPLHYSVELRGPVVVRGDVDAAHEVRLQAAFDMTDRLTLGATWEGAKPVAENEVTSGLLSVSADWDWGTEGAIHAGLTNAYGSGATGQAVFLGLDRSWAFARGWEVRGGIDMQRDLGAAQIPLGLQSDNPWIATSFTATRAGLRYTAATWSLGIDAENRTAPEGERGNLRLSGDGAFGQGWTFGAEMLQGFSNENGAAQSDAEAKLSFAHRRAAYDPITLFELEMDDATDDGVATHRLEASVLHSRYLGKADHLSLRGSLRGVEIRTDNAGATDTLTLLGIEYRHDLSETLDIGLHNSVVVSARTGDTRASYGVSMGLSPFENGYIEVGYNIEGFRDEEFSKNGYTDRGVFMEYRMKFDQDSIRDAFR